MTTQISTRAQAYPGAAGSYPRSHSPVHAEPEAHAGDGGERLAQWLGWLSLGLGASALAAPRQAARCIGARGDRTDQTVLQLVGVQELACGLGLLASRRPAGWLWARVAGDALHLTMLGGTLLSGPPRPDRMAAATAAIAGIAAVDAYSAARLSRHAGEHPARGALEVAQAITINRSAGELYRFWRDIQNLPRIMGHLQSVELVGDRRSHWRANGPAGTTVAWDAEITEDRPNERIAWRSLGGQVDNEGSVRFVPAPGGRGTEVHVHMRYNPPGGAAGRWFARRFGASAEQQVYDELRHFKQVMEVGEVVLSEVSGGGTRMVQRPAQPAAG
jgi:uncharacterized membrane protein